MRIFLEINISCLTGHKTHQQNRDKNIIVMQRVGASTCHLVTYAGFACFEVNN